MLAAVCQAKMFYLDFNALQLLFPSCGCSSVADGFAAKAAALHSFCWSCLLRFSSEKHNIIQASCHQRKAGICVAMHK